MKKIVFYNQKGGVGKSTSVVNVAGALECRLKKKVLVVDCDSQMSTTKYLLTTANGLDRIEYDICDVLDGTPAKDALVQVVHTDRNEQIIERDIFVLPASEQLQFDKIEDIEFFYNILEEFENEFDYCLFDLPAHVCNVTVAALAYADAVVGPLKAEDDSVEGLGMLIDTVNGIQQQNPKLRFLGVFFGDYMHQRKVERELAEYVREELGDLVFKQSIKSGTRVRESRRCCLPMVYYAPSDPITDQFVSLTREIVSKVRGEQ